MTTEWIFVEETALKSQKKSLYGPRKKKVALS